MGYLLAKILISGTMVVLIAEISKHSPIMGAITASLPLISILGMMLLWHETKEIERVASHSRATIWFVLPSLPMFYILPMLMERGYDFYPSLAIACSVTVMLYLLIFYIS